MAEQREPALGRHGIRQRVMSVVAVGTLAVLATLGWVGWSAYRSVRAQLIEERRLVARAQAQHVARLLDDEMELLSTLAVDLDVARGTPQGAWRVLEGFRRSRLLDTVFVARLDDAQPLVQPESGRALDAATVEAARGAARTNRPTILRSHGADAVALLVVPLRDGGTVVGAVGGTMPPEQGALRRVLAASTPSPAGWAEIDDASGATVIAAGVRPAHGSPVPPLLTAEAPIGETGWTVSIHQPDQAALATVYELRRGAVLLAPLVLGVALLLAWGAALSIVRPLGVLTRVAERLARGDLDRPVRALGTDEAGRLARALDNMRVALKQRERDRIRGELLKKTIAAQEDERKRIARELHDETSQTINALLMGMDAALERYPSDYSRDRFAEMRLLAGRLLEGVHRLILDLRPSILDDLGLFSAIEWFAHQHLEPLGIAVTIEVSGAEVRLPRDTELALFRAAQEAIANIARHSGADQVLVQCCAGTDRFTIEIEDDGSGFDVGDVKLDAGSMRGLGLAGMRERVSLVGGQITIDSTPGSGTRIVIEVALSPQDPAHA